MPGRSCPRYVPIPPQIRPNSGAATAIFVSWSLPFSDFQLVRDAQDLASPTSRNRTHRLRAPRRDASPSCARRYLSRLYMSLKYRCIGVSSGPPSLGTDSEVFRNLGNTLCLRGRPAVDLPESESVREPGVEAETPREPRVQRQDRLSSDELLARPRHEHAPVLLCQVPQDSAGWEIEEPFVHPGREPQVHERIPGKPIGEDRAPQDPLRQRDFSEVAEEVVERHGPRVQMQEPRMPMQVDVDVIVIAHPDRLREPGHPQDSEDAEGDDPRRPHPHDPRLDPAPGQSVHDPPGDCRLARSVRSHDCVDPGNPPPGRLACGNGIWRFRAIGLTAKMRHGKRFLVISVVPQNGAGVTSPSPQRVRNIKVIGQAPPFSHRLHGARIFRTVNPNVSQISILSQRGLDRCLAHEDLRYGGTP